jgi:hypothetical protein
MSKPTLNHASLLLLASALVLTGCSAASSSFTTISSRDGIRETHQTTRQAPGSDLASIQALADESAAAAAQVESHSSTQGEFDH